MSHAKTQENETYRVVLLGLVDPSEPKIQAFAQKLSTTFKIPTERALRIAEKPPVVIKKGISRSKAERYEQFFAKLGGQVRIEAAKISLQPARAEGFETTSIETGEAVVPPPLPGMEKQELSRSEPTEKVYDDDIAGAYEEGFAPLRGGSSEPSQGSLFQCPQCGQKQEKRVECIKCGIIFEKHERMAQTESDAETVIIQSPSQRSLTLEVAPPGDGGIRIEPAGFWIRTGAYVVDSLVFTLAVGGLGVILFLLLGGLRNVRMITSLSPALSLAPTLLFFAYNIYFLGNRGYTPGKGFLGLQVIRQDGTGLSYGDAAVRTFSYILSSIVFYLGFLWIAFDRKKHGWHDKIAKTQVIRAEEVAAWRKWLAILPAVIFPLTGIVAAVAIPLYSGYASRAEVVKAVSEMQAVKNNLEEHFYRYDRYPLTGEFRSFLRTSLGRVPGDPFNHGRPYRYESDGSSFTLWSIGPDRVDNGAMIPYDPFLKRGFKQQGDIIIHSDQVPEESDELFGMTPSMDQSTGERGELLGMIPATDQGSDESGKRVRMTPRETDPSASVPE